MKFREEIVLLMYGEVTSAVIPLLNKHNVTDMWQIRCEPDILELNPKEKIIYDKLTRDIDSFIPLILPKGEKLARIKKSIKYLEKLFYEIECKYDLINGLKEME